MSSTPQENAISSSALDAMARQFACHAAFLVGSAGDVVAVAGKTLPPQGLLAAAKVSLPQARNSPRPVESAVMVVGGRAALVSLADPAGSGDVLVAAVGDEGRQGIIAALPLLIASLLAGIRAERLNVETSAIARKLEAALRGSSALIELGQRAASADDLPAALSLLAEDLREAFGCSRVILTLPRRGGMRTAAVSGLSELSKRGSALLAAENILHDCAEKETMILPEDTPRELGVDLLRETGSVACFASAMKAAGGDVAGGWMLLWGAQPQDPEETEKLAVAAGPVLAGVVQLLRKALPGPRRGFLLKLWREAGRDGRRVAMIAAGLLGLFLVWPVALPVETEAEIIPEIRRAVSAPFDAVLRRAHIRAGDTVNAGDLLAVLDDRELRWQLADLTAQRARAIKQAEMAIREDRIAEARAAELNAESLSQQEKLIADRISRLEVRSPISGVVLTGDLDRVEGVPLRTGELLFEIAPLDRVVVRLYVTQGDAGFVRPDQAAEARFEFRPGRVWESRITRIHPQAEQIGTEALFPCEMVLENSDGALRPGAKGRGRISTLVRPRIWNYLRGAWNWLELRIW